MHRGGLPLSVCNDPGIPGRYLIQMLIRAYCTSLPRYDEMGSGLSRSRWVDYPTAHGVPSILVRKVDYK